MYDALARIIEAKRREIAGLDAPDPRRLTPSDRGFRDALAERGLSVIAEIKRKSPSAGVLGASVDPVVKARTYESGGASALSVLTDATFFGGSRSDLERARAGVALPVLRKDFLVDPVQIAESREMGADACLLIAAALDAAELRDMTQRARDLGMDALLEVRDERELEAALDAGSGLIGVNNRNLADLTIDPETIHRLAPLVPDGVVLVSESGIRDPESLRRLPGRVDAVLIGTALMTSDDPAAFLREARRAREAVS